MSLDLEALTPTVDDVGKKALAHTRDADGRVVGTFDDRTKLKAVDVMTFIIAGRDRVIAATGGQIAAEWIQLGRDAITEYAAAQVEAALAPEAAGQDAGAYQRHFDAYTGAVRLLTDLTTSDPGDTQAIATVALTSPTLGAAARYGWPRFAGGHHLDR